MIPRASRSHWDYFWTQKTGKQFFFCPPAGGQPFRAAYTGFINWEILLTGGGGYQRSSHGMIQGVDPLKGAGQAADNNATTTDVKDKEQEQGTQQVTMQPSQIERTNSRSRAHDNQL